MPPPRLVLASASPARLATLRAAGLEPAGSPPRREGVALVAGASAELRAQHALALDEEGLRPVVLSHAPGLPRVVAGRHGEPPDHGVGNRAPTGPAHPSVVRGLPATRE